VDEDENTKSSNLNISGICLNCMYIMKVSDNSLSFSSVGMKRSVLTDFFWGGDLFYWSSGFVVLFFYFLLLFLERSQRAIYIHIYTPFHRSDFSFLARNPCLYLVKL